ncbi:60S ribosomal protein L31 [Candidatus Woesearchaeota archaeon]|nr:60S ribosomal protein L31 [Candidatus Woesearchaeota archaeon]
MAEIKRSYNVPLRREFLKAPRYKRAKKAVTALKQFMTRHMKSENIIISEELNELIWKNGIKNPPHHVKVDVLKDDEGTVFVQLEGKEIKNKKQDKKEKPANKAEEIKEKLTKTAKKKAEDLSEKVAKEVTEEKPKKTTKKAAAPKEEPVVAEEVSESEEQKEE